MSVGRLSEFNPNEEHISAYVLRLKHYFQANKVDKENHVSVLITAIGPQVLAVLADLVSPNEVDSKSYDELVKVLKDHYAPKKLVVAERYSFYSRAQRPGESVSDFVVAIKHLAHSCQFGTFLKDALRDKLISGIGNDSIRQRLLSEELDFDKTYSRALMLEQAEKQSNLFHQASGSVGLNVSKIHMQGGGKGPKSNFNSNFSNQKSSQNVQARPKCFRCGSTEHGSAMCQYSGFKCHGCKKVGHLRKMCRSSTKNAQDGRNFVDQGRKPKRPVHQVEEVAGEIEELSLYHVGYVGDSRSYKVNMNIEGIDVHMEVDTGSAVTLSPVEIFEKLMPKLKVSPSSVKLVTYAGNEVPVVGQVDVNVIYGEQKACLPIVLVDIAKKQQPMLLGRNWLSQIKLDWQAIVGSNVLKSISVRPRPNTSVVDAQVALLKSKFQSVFRGGTGEIKGVEAHIVLKDGTVPMFCKARPVPFALREQVEAEIDRMINEGVAYKVTNSEWSTPLVVDCG